MHCTEERVCLGRRSQASVEVNRFSSRRCVIHCRLCNEAEDNHRDAAENGHAVVLSEGDGRVLGRSSGGGTAGSAGGGHHGGAGCSGGGGGRGGGCAGGRGRCDGRGVGRTALVVGAAVRLASGIVRVGRDTLGDGLLADEEGEGAGVGGDVGSGAVDADALVGQSVLLSIS